MYLLGVLFKITYINNSLHFVRKYVRIFVRGHHLFREANSFHVSIKEQMMSKDKYPCIFSSQMARDYCLYYPSNIFHKNWGIIIIIIIIIIITRAVLKIGVYSRIFPSFSREYSVT